MGQLLLWWLVFEVMGLIGLPVTFRLFSARADHGYGFAKIFTLLVVSYVAWIVGHLGMLSYGACLNLAIVGYIVVSAVLFATAREPMLAWLRSDGLRAIVLHDALWTVGLLFFAWQRSLGPEIMGAEKYMDFAFYNTLARTDVMPPQDPWMSGEVFNYYYFGYQMMANLARLVPLPTALSYNFCVASLGGLAFSEAVAAGLALTRSLPFGLMSGVMMTVIGNLDGFWQFLERGSLQNFDYWRSTRIIGKDATINEFPYFTIIHGDMHPHFIVMTVTILLWAMLTDPDRRRPAPEAMPKLGDLSYYLPIAFVLGSAVVISPWELPVGALTTFILLQRPLPIWPLISWGRIGQGVIAGAMVVLGYAAYYPFYHHFEAPGGGVGVKFATTALGEFLTVFGLLLALPAFFMAQEVSRSSAVKKEVLQALAATAVLVTLIATLAGNAVFVVLVAMVGATLVAAYRVEDGEQRIASLLTLGALAAILACEIVFIRDAYGDKLYRMNTVFKLYFQAWILLVLAGPWFFQQMLDAKRTPAAVRGVSALVLGGLLLASCAYPAGITMSRLGRSAMATLDGNDYLRREHPGDFAAVNWLRENAVGLPVILEATGDPYSYYARFSSNVGLPTIMGWSNHEGLWRSHESRVGSRRNEVIKMYSARTLAEVTPLLDQYNVTYIVVGELERKDYPAEGLAKFGELKQVFEANGTKIYQR